MDGLGTDEAQVARPQLLPQSEHAALQTDAGWSARLAGCGRLIPPVHLVQVLSVRARQPVLQMSQANAQAPRHGALRLPTTNRRHHRRPIFFRAFFMTRNLPELTYIY